MQKHAGLTCSHRSYYGRSGEGSSRCGGTGSNGAVYEEGADEDEAAVVAPPVA